MGYDPVMHDKGSIPYTQKEPLEDSCYNELEKCDIVICIIGNKYGTTSAHGNYSITMNELQTAIKSKKKIYVYILRDVEAENKIYIANKNKEFLPYYADNIEIHKFIESIKLENTHFPIIPFENINDITNNLRQQFAGLFQNLLYKDASITETKTIIDIEAAVRKMDTLLTKFEDQETEFFNKFNGTIYAFNSIINYLLKLLGVSNYRLFVHNKIGLEEFLKDLGFEFNSSNYLPGDNCIYEKHYIDSITRLVISDEIFDNEGNVQDIRKNLNNYIRIEKEEKEYDASLPF